jgi:hypothetical protein
MSVFPKIDDRFSEKEISAFPNINQNTNECVSEFFNPTFSIYPQLSKFRQCKEFVSESNSIKEIIFVRLVGFRSAFPKYPECFSEIK